MPLTPKHPAVGIKTYSTPLPCFDVAPALSGVAQPVSITSGGANSSIEAARLPVALRNCEITEADVLLLAEKAAEMCDAGEPSPPRRIREGTRTGVK